MTHPPTSYRDIEEKLAGMVGKRLSAFRNSYRRMADAHVGELLPRANAPEKAVHKDRGEFIIDMRDCDRAVTLADNASLSSPVDGDEAVLDAMSSLVGQVVSDVSLQAESLTFRMTFSNGASLTLIGDMEVSPESEQWAITFPDHTSLVAEGRALRIESSPST